jgi:AhpD family alkylhydroperoxidase
MTDIKEAVREKYSQAAVRASSCCGARPSDPITSDLYSVQETGALPEAAVLASLGCGNPTALADLKPGQVVLDLGSGGGFDVFIAARKVAPSGHAIGVDMTPQMLDKARASIGQFTAKTGLSNVEFRLGEIEHLPVADASVDVIISNCVINLSADKPQVWREVSRVLKPGGKVCVSDLALKKPLPETIREMAIALVGCVAGAVSIDQTVEMAKAAGLANIHWTEKEYAFDIMEDCNDHLYQSVKDALPKGQKLSDYIVSINLTAEKSAAETLTPVQKELIAIGASVTAHCQSCLIWHLDKARQVGASEKEIDIAISIGKAIQKGSVAAMESFINEQQGRCVPSHESICTFKETKQEQDPKPGKSSCCGR